MKNGCMDVFLNNSLTVIYIYMSNGTSKPVRLTSIKKNYSLVYFGSVVEFFRFECQLFEDKSRFIIFAPLHMRGSHI